MKYWQRVYIGGLAVSAQSANIKPSKFYSLWNSEVTNFLLHMDHGYAMLLDTALPSVVPSLSGKDIHLVNTAMKWSMEESGIEKKCCAQEVRLLHNRRVQIGQYASQE